MTGRERLPVRIIVGSLGYLAVLATASTLKGRSEPETGNERTESDRTNPKPSPSSGSKAEASRSNDEESRARRKDTTTYAVGYALALLLTCAAFAAVHWHWMNGATTLGIVVILALVQIVVHFRCFLHIDLSRSARDDLQLILFSALIICLMVGGTIVILLNLRMRMM